MQSSTPNILSNYAKRAESLRECSKDAKLLIREGHNPEIGAPGLYVTNDPGAHDDNAKQGIMPFPVGLFFEKGLTMGAGQANVKRYNRYLCDLIISGVAKPSFVVSHEINIEEAPIAYEKFDKRIDGYIKVLIHPQE